MSEHPFPRRGSDAETIRAYVRQPRRRTRISVPGQLVAAAALARFAASVAGLARRPGPAQALAPPGVTATLVDGLERLPHFNPDDPFDPASPTLATTAGGCPDATPAATSPPSGSERLKRYGIARSTPPTHRAPGWTRSSSTGVGTRQG